VTPDQGLELAGGFAQRLLRHLPLGNVAGDFGEADQSIVLIADCIDLDRRPEPAAVLAYVPAFRLVVAVAGRGFENAGGQASHAIVASVKSGEVLSDDFRRRITL
jgi:hypothetical protein